MNQPRLFRTVLQHLEAPVARRSIYIPRRAPRHALRTSPSSQPRHLRQWATSFPQRWQSTLTSPTEARTPAEVAAAEDRWANTPAYEMSFTCKPCSTRSTHKISKQGYHHGTVLITCPSCKNRHLIADHMKIFSDTRVTLEDIMKEKGQLIKKGSLSTKGDVEFWDDGTEVKRDA